MSVVVGIDLGGTGLRAGLVSPDGKMSSPRSFEHGGLRNPVDAIEAVVQRLTGLALSAPGFLLLLGASGYGKSSLVRAGVVPRLKSNRDRNWKVLKPFTPKGAPFTRLREVLGEAGAAIVEPAPEVGHEVEEAALQVQLQKLSAGPWVVVIDQFEELLVDGNQEGERFLAFLQRLLSEGLSTPF